MRFNCFIILTRLVIVNASVHIAYPKERKVSQVALALSEIINGLDPQCLTILAVNSSFDEDVDDFIYKIHELHIKSAIFFNSDNYFNFIESTIAHSTHSWSLIFNEPYDITKEIHARNLAHRLSLFIFYWGAEKPPHTSTIRFEEPIRVAVLTRPRISAFRIYYNQATSEGKSKLRLVNWYDEESLGLYKTPLLPDATSVYSNLHGRIFYVPVIHSPPWHFVIYHNNSANITSSASGNRQQVRRYFNVIGGRDHHLLKLIASKMNFKFVYVDPRERTQGSSVGSERNSLFTGELGMIQNNEAHFLFGDVGLSWERMKAAEFSFFTLIDSVAFTTHAPRRLNEALALVRPFKINVWPYLILTVLLSGPMFYLVIVIPYRWGMSENHDDRVESVFHSKYINEITLTKIIKSQKFVNKRKIPPNLFAKSIWFTIQLFLKQSCSEPYSGARARFLIIVYWIAATYVLADVYSAQLTSLFARPARESPIDSLQRLENAMKYKNYQLFIEKDSSVLEMLENSTEIFRRLYKLMKRQSAVNGDAGYTINSIEEGIQSILDGAEKVILGGRETLYFNMKRYGTKNFQLSQQLYSRYSAVAVQIGCPFLESFNNVLINLFESGIMDKITITEYEKMLTMKDLYQEKDTDNDKDEYKPKSLVFESNTQPINLRMLQGAFIILLFGSFLAAIILLFEVICYRKTVWISETISNVTNMMCRQIIKLCRSFSNYIVDAILTIFHYLTRG